MRVSNCFLVSQTWKAPDLGTVSGERWGFPLASQQMCYDVISVSIICVELRCFWVYLL